MEVTFSNPSLLDFISLSLFLTLKFIIFTVSLFLLIVLLFSSLSFLSSRFASVFTCKRYPGKTLVILMIDGLYGLFSFVILGVVSMYALVMLLLPIVVLVFLVVVSIYGRKVDLSASIFFCSSYSL